MTLSKVQLGKVLPFLILPERFELDLGLVEFKAQSQEIFGKKNNKFSLGLLEIMTPNEEACI
jgi:hypothetical protein